MLLWQAVVSNNQITLRSVISSAATKCKVYQKILCKFNLFQSMVSLNVVNTQLHCRPPVSNKLCNNTPVVSV